MKKQAPVAEARDLADELVHKVKLRNGDNEPVSRIEQRMPKLFKFRRYMLNILGCVGAVIPALPEGRHILD
jgi:hypothetical protein